MTAHNRFRTRLQLESLEDRTVPALFNPGTVEQLHLDVNAAKTNGEEDIINLAAGATYSLTESLVFTNDGPVTINGNGATLTRASGPGTPQFGIIKVDDGATLSVDRVTITNGVGNGANGGGISVGTSASMTVANSTISGNVARVGGGGISGGSGGGIFAREARVTIANSTISGNIAEVGGGGIFVGSLASVTVANSTISGNIANDGG